MQDFSLAQLREIVSLLPDPAFILGSDGSYIAYLGGVESKSYHDVAPLVGQSLYQVMPKEQAKWFHDQINLALNQGEVMTVEYDLNVGQIIGVDDQSGPEGVLRFEGKVVPLQSLFNGQRAVLWLTRNITRRHKLEQKLLTLSQTDVLTGFYNRRYLLNALKQHLHLKRRRRQPASIILIDIDYFKPINDQFGHLIGDAVLKEVCSRVKLVLRTEDIAARIGGEEFILLLPSTQMAEAMVVAERIRHDFEAMPIQCGEHSVQITVSAGVTELMPSDSVSSALNRVDKALYSAKSSGRNRVCSS